MRLQGFTIGITADRRGEDQAVMFRRLGAEVLHAPTMQTVKDPPAELRERTEDFIADPPDYLIANTGFGMRLWLGHAAGWGLEDALKEALGRVRIAARGPKAAGSLTSNGLTAWWRAPGETLAEVADHLASVGVDGQRVAFQLQGQDTPAITRQLEEAGARVTTIPVYRWVRPEPEGAVAELIEKTVAGGIDAVTFTAGPQVHYLVEMAEAGGRADQLIAALNGRVVVGCIGPVCAAAAREEGIERLVIPENWRLGSLVKEVAEALAPAGGAEP